MPLHRPIVLIVRDGWGENPRPEWSHANAVHLARHPVDDRLTRTYPFTLIRTHGRDVGLPAGVMGNSEVGHQNLGAGRIVEQEIMRITGQIQDGRFFQNPVFLAAFEHAGTTGGAMHLMGLCSDGRVHSDLDHLYGLMDMVRRVGFPGERVFVHAFTDGRDTAPTAGLSYLKSVDDRCRKAGVRPIASVIGRYYAMDRDGRWDRIERAYRLLVHGEGKRFPSAVAALEHYYEHPTDPNRHGDEFVTPSVIESDSLRPATIRDEDSVVFFNYRGDRPRQLTRAFVCDAAPGPSDENPSQIVPFPRPDRPRPHFVTMTAYESALPVHVAFDKPPRMTDILGSYVADRGLRQFRCAETEKYAHVTFFFNDYRDEPFRGEDRLLIPSPRDVTTYNQKPEMSAREVTDAVLRRLSLGVDDLMVINYANGDMIGHTGDLSAAVRAVEVVDECVGRVVDAVLARGGALIVTADHGNCEQMVDPETGGPHTAHTTHDVKLILVDDRFRSASLRNGGRLADVAPTLLHLLDVPVPAAMTGQSLIETSSGRSPLLP